MYFLLCLAVGFLAGILGGMGMGGGTVLIPALTIFLGVNQRVAQATNLIAFLPMAAFVLPSHAKRGLLVKSNFWEIVIPAALTTATLSAAVSFVPVQTLKKLFGFFLIALAVKQIFSMPAKQKKVKGQAKFF